MREKAAGIKNRKLESRQYFHETLLNNPVADNFAASQSVYNRKTSRA